MKWQDRNNYSNFPVGKLYLGFAFEWKTAITNYIENQNQQMNTYMKSVEDFGETRLDCLSVCLSACLSVCLSICMSVCSSICLFVCLSICLSSSSFDSYNQL